MEEEVEEEGGVLSNPLRHQLDQHRLHQLNTYLLYIQPDQRDAISSLLSA